MTVCHSRLTPGFTSADVGTHSAFEEGLPMIPDNDELGETECTTRPDRYRVLFFVAYTPQHACLPVRDVCVLFVTQNQYQSSRPCDLKKHKLSERSLKESYS